MSSSTHLSFALFPKWREERDKLVREVHGEAAPVFELELPSNRVSSKEKYTVKKLVNKQQIDDQKFQDFLLACDGLNNASFEYSAEDNVWAFSSSNYQAIVDNSNNNYEICFSEYDSFTAMMLTKIQQIKNYLNHFEGNAHFGRCIAILADEFQRFFKVDFKQKLRELHDKPDVTKSTLQSVHESFSEPLNSMMKFLSSVDATCSVGGHLLNLIKKERDSLDKCYRNCFHDLLTRAYKRGMEFYVQLLIEWLNNNNLENDLFFEFFIWDVTKRRCSSIQAQPQTLVVAFDELIFLEGLSPIKYHNPIDVKSFKRKFMIVPELWPVEFNNSLLSDIVKIGLYNHVLMLEDKEKFNGEIKNVESLTFESLSNLPALVKNRYRHSGRVVLRHLCTQLDFTILMEKLPFYFCGLKNFVIDGFVELTENYDWSGLSQHKNAKLTQLNRLYQRAIELSPLANDQLSQLISLEFSVIGQVDSGHPPTTNYSTSNRPLIDLEPILFCKDSFRMAFPPQIFETYRNLFRLRHTLRRALFLLKNKHFNFRKQMSYVEANALSLMIRFVQSYDNFVFGYRAQKLVYEYLNFVKEGIQKSTLDLDSFLNEHERMVSKIRVAAFVSSDPETFSNSMWAILTRMLSYATNASSFKSTCIEIGRFLRKINQHARVQVRNGNEVPEIVECLSRLKFPDAKSLS